MDKTIKIYQNALSKIQYKKYKIFWNVIVLWAGIFAIMIAVQGKSVNSLGREVYKAANGTYAGWENSSFVYVIAGSIGLFICIYIGYWLKKLVFNKKYPCPACKASIVLDASKCRYCGSVVEDKFFAIPSVSPEEIGSSLTVADKLDVFVFEKGKILGLAQGEVKLGSGTYDLLARDTGSGDYTLLVNKVFNHGGSFSLSKNQNQKIVFISTAPEIHGYTNEVIRSEAKYILLVSPLIFFSAWFWRQYLRLSEDFWIADYKFDTDVFIAILVFLIAPTVWLFARRRSHAALIWAFVSLSLLLTLPYIIFFAYMLFGLIHRSFRVGEELVGLLFSLLIFAYWSLCEYKLIVLALNFKKTSPANSASLVK